jgi:hypothetical protein
MVKQKKINPRIVCWIIIFALVFAGCSVQKQPKHHHGIQAPEMVRELQNRLSDLYPNRFNALHRVGMNIQGKTIVLKGYLKVDRPAGDVDLIAQGEMGGSLFEVSIRGGKTDLIKVSEPFKPQWIEQSAARDLMHLYLIPDFHNPVAFTEALGLNLFDTDENENRIYIFRKGENGGLKLSEFCRKQNNRTVYKIEYTYAPESDFPSFIKLENRTLDYTLEINVRYMVP